MDGLLPDDDGVLPAQGYHGYGHSRKSPHSTNNLPLWQLSLVIVNGFTMIRAKCVSVLPFLYNREIGVCCGPTCYTNRVLPV